MTDGALSARVAGAIREARAALAPRSLLDEAADRGATEAGSRAAAAFGAAFLAGTRTTRDGARPDRR